MVLAVPTQDTYTVGEILTAALMNKNVRDAVGFLESPPLFSGSQAAAQSFANAAFGAVLIDTESVDSYNGHSTSTNTSRYTAVVAGWYDIIGNASFAPNGTGRRITSIWVNGTEIGNTRVEVTPSATVSANAGGVASGPVFLNVGDFVEVRAFQSSGGLLSLAIATLVCQWIHS